ncbi:MAG: hypothetical protein JST96_14700, partial [Bacteroidetes bacterium]|nr:hypothetical protein [Bacteroidota bacterium]
MHINSTENNKYTEARSISGRQQTLSQVIAKDVAILSGVVLNNEQAQSVKDSLAAAIETFQKQQEFLAKQDASEQLPIPQQIFDIRILLSSANPHYSGLVKIGTELSKADSNSLASNRGLYLRSTMSNEQSYLALMREITKRYTAIVNEKNNEAST